MVTKISTPKTTALTSYSYVSLAQEVNYSILGLYNYVPALSISLCQILT